MTAVATPPKLYWNFAVSKSLTPTLGSVTPVCVRSSAATYRDASGIVQVAAANIARFDHHPTTFASRGLFLEESRTNNLNYSAINQAGFDAAAWSQTGAWANASKDYLATTAPDGTLTATRIKDDLGGDGLQIVGLNHGMSLAAAGSVASIHVKADQHSKIVLATINFTNVVSSYFDCATGAWEQLNHATGFIVPCANGWFRIGVFHVPGADNNGHFSILAYETVGVSTAQTDGTSTFFAWGAQCETGTSMSSYIPTTTASVTRTGDIARVASGLTAVPVFPTGDGSYYSQFDTTGSHQASGAIVATGTPGLTEFEANGTMEITGVGSWNTFATFSIGEHKFATGFNSTSQRTFGDGTAGTLEANTWTTPHANPDVLVIGSRSAATLTGNLKYIGRINSLAVWNSRLTDAELDGLTDGTLLPYEPPAPSSGTITPGTMGMKRFGMGMGGR